MPAEESLFSNWGQLLANSLAGSVRVSTQALGLNESGPQLAQVQRNSRAGLPVCACLCPGGFGCRAEAGQIQIIARQREGRGGGEARWEGLSLGLHLGDVKLGICCSDRLVLFVGP